ncbi:MAG: hypothetical protein ACVCEJ_04335 [Candidatus Izemoplasmataceae bacterium]
MSNRIKIKKPKSKESEIQHKADHKESKKAGKFLKAKQEKGTQKSSFSGKATKEYSRKKT